MSYRLEAVQGSTSPDFDAAYAALAGEFAARGELERREVLARWLDAQRYATQESTRSALGRRYHLIVARDEQGVLAGVRDCHVLVDVTERIAVVYLAHVLVLEPYRRTGLGQLFRTLPIDLGRQALERAGLDASADLLLAAEMEPWLREDEASSVRLVAYGKAGFRAISPAALPYHQPDFRALPAQGVAAKGTPLPLLAIVRWVGHESATTLPKRLAQAFVQHLFAVFRTHVEPIELERLCRHTLGALDAFALAEVPLLPLPSSNDDLAALAPLSRARVLAHFPEQLR